MKKIALFLLCVLSAADHSYGLDYFWDPSDTDAVDTDWANPLNWLDNAVPDASINHVIINNTPGRQPVISSDIGTIQKILVAGTDAVLDVQTNGLVNMGDLHIAQWSSGATVNVNGGTINAANIQVGVGNTFNLGTMNLNSGYVSGDGLYMGWGFISDLSRLNIVDGTMDIELIGFQLNALDEVVNNPIIDISGSGQLIAAIAPIDPNDPPNTLDQLALVNQYITGGYITAFGGAGTVLVDTTTDPMKVIVSALIALEGDLNGDGFVGVDDLNIVLVNWNQNVTPGDLSAGDPTGEGFVGVDDLNIVLINWNVGTPPAGGSAIPEPTSAIMLGLGGLAVLRRR